VGALVDQLAAVEDEMRSARGWWRAMGDDERVRPRHQALEGD